MPESIDLRQGIRDLPEIVYALGVEKVILCPGSRSAPLTIAFARYGKAECLSIVDERSAAYFALGIAQYSAKPVVLVCTSGTAALNFAPAVAEAYYQNLPLIVITADRPGEWIDQSDGQTIRQTNLYSNYIKASYEIPGEIYTPDHLWHSNRKVSEAVITATTGTRGPVHINVPLKEPLYTALPEKSSVKHLIKPEILNSKAEIADYTGLYHQLNAFGLIWLVMGVAEPDNEISALIQRISQKPNVIVVAENISNLSGEGLITNPDSFLSVLTETDKENLRPDLLITVGHSVVSKRLKVYLRKYAPRENWQIGNFTQPVDTYKSLTRIFKTSKKTFLTGLLHFEKTLGISLPEIEKRNHQLNLYQNEYISGAGYSDFTCIHEIVKQIPENSILHLANSTPIRYSQLFVSRKNLHYYSNRGTSGIDGCTSTAVGSAYISRKPAFLISGDLAFLYDSNAMWNKYIPQNFKIIVMNNGGGNIFSLIDTSPEMEPVKEFFTTPQQISIEQLVKAYGFEYFNITKPSSFNEVFQAFKNCGKPSVLEIVTDHDTNVRVYKEYFRFLENKSQLNK